MFATYKLRPDTIRAIHVTPDNYRDVADWIAANLADDRGVDTVHPGTKGQGVPRLTFNPATGGHVGVTIPGYLVAVTWPDGRVSYQGDAADTFDAQWQPADD